MKPTGAFDPTSSDLVLSRRFSATIDDVWASITVSERLARWFGTWTGDPSTGTVMVTMNAEPDEYPAVAYHIEACEPPLLLVLHTTDDHGTWHLRAALSGDGSGTVLELRQQRVERSSVPDVGPGWEWYLDRLVAALDGSEPPGMDAFEERYMPLSADYAALVDDASSS